MRENILSFIILLLTSVVVLAIKPQPPLISHGLVALVPSQQAQAATAPQDLKVEYQVPSYGTPIGIFSAQLAVRSPIEDKKGALIDHAKQLAASVGGKRIIISLFGQAGPAYMMQGFVYS